MTKRAIIYARTASRAQINDQTQIMSQVRLCKTLARKSGLTVVETVLHEGVNGMNDSDKRLLLGVCQKKKAKTFITYDIERISRNYTACIGFLFLLKAKGIDLLTVKSGECLVQEIFARCYKTALSRAIKRGINEAKRKINMTNES